MMMIRLPNDTATTTRAMIRTQQPHRPMIKMASAGGGKGQRASKLSSFRTTISSSSSTATATTPLTTRNEKLTKITTRPSSSLLLALVLVLSLTTSTSQLLGIGSQRASSPLVEASNAVQSTLLDTTEQSSLGWTKYPDGGPQTRTPGWVEESFTNFERGINWRSFVVCDVAFNSVNNWLWTPFIERGEANRLYIEIKFTMRDCNLFPQMVLSCKETFALLYKEMDAPIERQQQQQQQQQSTQSNQANASFAQSDSYTLIDAIAADEGRFTSNTDVVINTEIRSIPVTKRGVYFAFRDQGACLSLISIKVYHTYCPQLTTGLAHFNATPTGRDLTSLVAVEGQCVANSVQIEQPKMFCTADGNWNTMSSGQCKCLAGFEPANNHTKCQACPPGKFKSTLGELACQSCPERSSAPYAGATECRCHEGFHRAPRDPRSAPCTQPPGPPANLSAVYLDSNSVVLQWQAPKFTGHREDLTYKLLCDNCDQTQLVSSPQFYANFSETKCVLSGLSPATSYRFVVYAMNGVSQLAAAQAPQYSEISLQTARPVQQTTANTLSGQGGFQLMPIYNFRALPGARGTDMILAWDAQPLQSAAEAGGPSSSAAAQQVDGSPIGSSSDPAAQQLPSLYEIRFQPRYSADSAAGRRSPYPASLVGPSGEAGGSGAHGQQQQPQQSVTTTNRVVAIQTLSPRTEYAFQIRTKWAHSSQWSEFSEPIYMATTNQVPSAAYSSGGDYPFDLAGTPQMDSTRTNGGGAQGPFLVQPAPAQNQQQQQQQSSSWFGTFALFFLATLIMLAFVSVTLIHYRKSLCAQSFGAGFGTLGGGGGSSAYGGVYGSAGMGVGPLAGFGSPLGGGGHHQHHHHHATMSASSAGGLITGSNGTSRSSSGAGNVVQNFIAATLNQISGHHSNHHHHQTGGQAKGPNGAHTMGGADGKLFAPAASQPLQRNHYHQTLSGVNHHHHTAMLLNNNNNHFQQQQQAHSPQTLAHLSNQTAADLFKYRTLSQPGAQYVQQQQQQDHIYDDLDNTCATMQRQAIEIEPQRVTIDSVIGRGEFGDVCLASLRSPLTGAESRVAVKTLKPQASEKAKLDFLIEASIMSQLEHPNIIHLEGVVTKSEPAMIVTEFMENGALDAYLRDNKNRFTCVQLVSMLRGIASGMQYLAKLNYVHKDLAARNILVNGQNVCKIADFGLSAHQPSAASGGGGGDSSATGVGDYTNTADSTSTNSSNSLSSQTTGSTPTTASTMAGGGGGSQQLNQLQSVAEQIVQQRFALQPQAQQHQPAAPPLSMLMASPVGALSQQQQPLHQSIQNPKIPVRWTALEAIAFRRFTSASDVWSYGIVCWEVMSQGERPYWSWSNQDVIKAVEQGYRLPQPEGCPEQLYKMMLDCWLKDRAARPTFGQILKQLDRLLSPYDDPFCPQLTSPMLFGQQQQQQQQQHQLVGGQPQQPQLVPMHTRISSQEPAYYDTTYNPISQLMTGNKSAGPNPPVKQQQPLDGQQQQSVDDWLGSIKMSRYRENFQRHQINSLQYVARLSQTDLNLIGIQNGQHLKKILSAIQSLRSAASIGVSSEGYLV